MRILFIYNPEAGKKSKKDQAIKNYLNKYNVNFIWHDTSTGSFIQYDPDQFARIFACGGDGTIKEVAAWILSKHSQTPLAIIPIGSANILAQSLAIPLEINKALNLGFINNVHKIDVGLINNRYYFLIAAGCGFDARIIKNTSRKAKKAWGILAYVTTLILNFFNVKPNKFFLKFDGYSKTVTAQSIFISNFAKFFNLTLNPESRIDDGYLNISILKTLRLKDLLILIRRFLFEDYQKDWRYEFHKVKEIYILPFNKKTHMQIDGEVIELPYLDIKVLPSALNIIAIKLP
ncbi:MAG: diacylglycerol kinase family protein [Candidatus Parcubacteria bacterium]|nr:diacylglycerol kinase family protein [Candidatus Parcubacteria bacterium]